MDSLNVLHSHLLGDDKIFIETAAYCMGISQINWYNNILKIPNLTPDLVFLAGGTDVNFERYGGDWKLCFRPDLKLDVWDMKYIPLALQNEWPIFGICRGNQTLFVELGGKLIEEIYPLHGIHEYLSNDLSHFVDGLWGMFPVNSFHHQAIDHTTISNKVTITSWALDNRAESFIHGNFAMGVQWHPEWMDVRHSWQLVEAVVTKRVDKIAKFDPYEGIVYK